MLDDHPMLKAYLDKVRRDNLRFLTAAIAWNILVSAIPLTIGMVALSQVLFAGSRRQQEIVQGLSRAFQGVLKPHYLEYVVRVSVHHSYLLVLLSLVTALWGAWNVGFALSESFNAMFEVGSRPFLREKAIDIGMFFVLLLLTFGIVAATSTQGAVTQALHNSPLPSLLSSIVKTAVSVISAFVLFSVMYTVYPNTKKRLKVETVWRGSAIAAILFQLLTYVWPLYEAHFQKYGGLLFPVLVLILWVYLFSFILAVGAEIVAVAAIREAREHGEEVGPAPDDSVPHHRTSLHDRAAS